MEKYVYDKLSKKEQRQIDAKRAAKALRRGARPVDDWRTRPTKRKEK